MTLRVHVATARVEVRHEPPRAAPARASPRSWEEAEEWHAAERQAALTEMAQRPQVSRAERTSPGTFPCYEYEDNSGRNFVCRGISRRGLVDISANWRIGEFHRQLSPAAPRANFPGRPLLWAPGQVIASPHAANDDGMSLNVLERN